MWPLALFATVLALLLLYCIRDMRKPQHFPPGPPWVPLFGCGLLILELAKLFKFYHLMWAEMSRRYGPIVGFRCGNDRIVVVSGRDAIREFYAKEQLNGRPDGFFFRVRSFDRRLGVVFTDGTDWEQQRRFAVRTMKSLGMGKQGLVTVIEREATEMLDYFRRRAGGRPSLDMANAFDVPVMNVIWVLIAGQRFPLGDDRLKWLASSIHESFRVFDMSGGVLNQFPWIRHLCPVSSGYVPLKKLLQPLWAFLEETIEAIRCEADRGDNLIAAYLQELARDGHHTSFSSEQLLCLCLDLFQAGTETASNTLSFGVLYMLHHPAVLQRLHHELDTVVGVGRMPCYDDRIRLPYTEAVLCEIQRLANVAPLGIAHRTLEPVRLGAYNIPRDAIVIPSLYSLHMDPEYWHDPDQFRPERFLNATGDQLLQHDHFLPFGAGKRRCLGESMAKQSLFLFFATFVHCFTVQAATDQLPSMEGLDGITLSPQPYRIVIKERLI